MPFYRDQLTGTHALDPRDLQSFPLISRRVVEEHFSDFIVARRFPDFIVMSGGTSGHVVNATLRNEEEYEAVHAFLTGESPGAPPPPIEEIEHFGLDVYFNTNGYARRKPRGWPLICIPLERKVHVDLIAHLLVDGFTLNGSVIPARHLQAQNALHRLLAGYFEVSALDVGQWDLDSVFGYGSHVTRRWHERLQKLWGRAVTTSYGLSEFVGANAANCASCGALHFVNAWQEFVSPVDGSPVESGDAVLVLTSLVPFVVVQPRIRYLTGDLVRIQHRCPVTGLLGFQFRGRASSSVWTVGSGEATVVLSEVDVLEALDDETLQEEVRYRRHPAELQLWEDANLPRPSFPMGLPQFTVNGGELGSDNPTVVVRVEVEFDPTVEADRARRFKERLAGLLVSEVALSGPMTTGREASMRIEPLPSGALRAAFKTSA